MDLEKAGHSLSHVMTLAVKRLYGKDILLGFGPAIKNGFYQDFDYPFSQPDLEKIESEMRDIINSDYSFERELIRIEDAKEYYRKNNQKYKLELLEDIQKKGSVNSTESNEEIVNLAKDGFVSFNNLPEHKDLCKGGHTNSTIDLKKVAWKLDRIAGAYWRGDEKNQMLTRIYGLVFSTDKDLEKFLLEREEKKQYDHRVIGNKLDLFHFSEIIGSGLPLYTARGTIIRNLLKALILQRSKSIGVEEVTTPHIASIKTYEISGHTTKFKEELLTVNSQYEDGFAIKPVSCPHHTQLYASRPRSFRDLPIRYIESAVQYRDEKPGSIGGLTRVRSISVDDGHTFCAVEDIKDEVIKIIELIKDIHTELGVYKDHYVSISVRDSKNQDKYIGDIVDWDTAENMLKELNKELNLGGTVNEGEAALYGPKIDFMQRDNNGNERQLSTIQIDFSTAKRFKLTYVDSDGENKTPAIIHRAILGSYERFLAILLETTKGKLPFWLAPEQIRILTINDNVIDYAEEIKLELDNIVLNSPVKYNELRTIIDKRSESLGKKIREATMMKIPLIIIIGEKDKQAQQISLRDLDGNESKLDRNELEEYINNLV